MAYSQAQYAQDVTLMHDDALMVAMAHNVPYSLIPSEAERIQAENEARVSSPAYRKAERAIARSERATRRRV